MKPGGTLDIAQADALLLRLDKLLNQADVLYTHAIKTQRTLRRDIRYFWTNRKMRDLTAPGCLLNIPIMGGDIVGECDNVLHELMTIRVRLNDLFDEIETLAKSANTPSKGR